MNLIHTVDQETRKSHTQAGDNGIGSDGNVGGSDNYMSPASSKGSPKLQEGNNKNPKGNSAHDDSDSQGWTNAVVEVSKTEWRPIEAWRPIDVTDAYGVTHEWEHLRTTTKHDWELSDLA